MVLDILAEHHNKWISMTIALGVPQHMREDVVQEMYLKIAALENPSKMLYKETQPNTWYVYLTLQSVFIDVVRGEGPVCYYDDLAGFPLTTTGGVDKDFEEGWDKFYRMIMSSVRELGPYGAKLCEAYFSSDLSIRKIAREANISPTSIFHSIKKYREILQEEHWEDYLDFKHNDWTKI